MTAPRSTASSAAAIPVVAALVLCVLGLYPLANKLTDGDAVQWYAHARTFWLVIGGTVLLVLSVLARFQGNRIDQLWKAASDFVLRIPTPVFLAACALFALIASATLAIICFGRQPHNADEVAQLFHARILLSGRLSLPADPNPEFFGMDNMIDQGRWYSQFPVFGPAFLAIGLLLHAAWLVNPLLLALTVLSVYGFARRTYGEPTARASALLFALCPFALFVGASFMNHVPVLWLTSVAMWQLAIWMRADTSREAHRSAAIIGVALGVAFAVRPLDALVAAGVIGVMQLTQLKNGVRWRSLAAQIVGGLIPVAILFYVNWRTNGAPMRLGYDVLYGEAHSMGFHVDPYGRTHTPMRALLFASKYLLQLNVLLFEWPLPAVGIIIAGLLAMRRPTRWDYFLIGLLFAQTVCYALYWHDGSFRGPRFLFNALPAIVILIARTPFMIAALTRGTVRRAVILVLPACVLISWLVGGMSDSVPGRVRMYQRASPVLRIDPGDVARDGNLHNALVFINEGRQARNLHYLWELGLSRGDAARVMVTASSCAVRISIDAEVALQPARKEGRLDRLVKGALRFDAQEPPTLPLVCVLDVRRDEAGSASFGPFFPANEIGPDGHLGGNVVYALDLGGHNEVLRARFGDRKWYRFGPHKTPKDSMPSLIPYEETER
ncbi:MAG: glycosyltransferase family 39 protein [Gemmatimonadaceae bacterium]